MAYSPKTIGICGVGLLGGSIGAGLKASGFTGRIIGFSSPPSLGTALKLGCIDQGRPYEALEREIGAIDCLFLCSPIDAIITTLEILGRLPLPQGLVISDVGSTKGAIVAAARRALPSFVNFIGGHPMAGSEKSGAGASDPFLFQNAIYILSPVAPASGLAADFGAFLERFLGCRTIMLDAAVHDRIVAAVSHVPHILAVALVKLALRSEAEVQGTLRLAAGGFRDMTRIASAPWGMWRDILATNKDAIAPLVDELIGILGDMKKDLAEGSLEAAFEAASRARREIPLGSKGFITPLADIVVVARDQPGIIAAISNALARSRINIKDIEVLKVREGEAGSIRLAFESKEIARGAVERLNAEGFTARERN